MYAFIGKIIVGVIVVSLLMTNTGLGIWSLCGFFVPFLLGGD